MSVAEKLTAVAENMPNVYKAGQRAEYNAFWDKFIPIAWYESGIGYAPYFFAGGGWNDNNFKPNKNIRFVNSVQGLFRHSTIVNIKKCLEDCGVTLDLSSATNLDYAFAYGYTKYIPKVSLVSAKSAIQYIFAGDSAGGSKIIWIDEVEVAENNTFNKSFNYCKNLEHAIFTGTIASNGLNLQWSTLLDRESLLSIIDCLKDYSQDTSGTVWEVTVGAENLAKLTQDERKIAENKGWVIG